jgi:NodT family efflux transporter outer membrane factor (OMF) lipoprotein
MRRLVPALSCALAACAGPNAPSPPAAVSVPSQWRGALAGQGVVDVDWWKGFGDPALTRIVERALANNVDLAVAVARVEEARAQEALARSALLPTLDAVGAASRARTVSALGTPSESTTGQPLVQTAYEVDLFGRVHDSAAAAHDAYLASAAGRDAARLSVAGAAASAYIGLLGLDARRAVVRETIAARSEALRLARSRAKAGYTSDLELRQAEAEYQAAALILPQVDLAIARSENALRLLTGDVPGPVERGSTLAALVPPPLPAQGMPSDLLRRRPDVAQAELTLAASDRTLSVARKQFLPSLRLSASAGAVFSNALPDPITIWSVGGSILAPLFEGGRLTANRDSAVARRDQAAFAYRKATLTAFREVEDALAAIDSLSRQRHVAEAQRVAIAATLRHATSRYQAGYSSYLEQLDAQRALLSADLQLVQIRADQMSALVTLYQTLGGGWSGVAEAAE